MSVSQDIFSNDDANLIKKVQRVKPLHIFFDNDSEAQLSARFDLCAILQAFMAIYLKIGLSHCIHIF